VEKYGNVACEMDSQVDKMY